MLAFAQKKIQNSIRQPKVVLIVEDDPVSRRALQVLLSYSGYAVTAVSTGEEALAFASRCFTPVIALVDFNLPGMDGLDLISRLSNYPFLLTPLLITASGDELIRDLAMQRSIRFVRKPINFRQLTAFLSEI